MIDGVFLSVAWLRHDHDGTFHLDCFSSVRWPDGVEAGGLEMMAKIEEVNSEEWLNTHGFQDAARLAFHEFKKMELRARFNMLEGPFIFKTDEQLDARTMLRVIVIHRKEKLYAKGRKGA